MTLGKLTEAEMWLFSPTFCLSQVIASACFTPKQLKNCSFGWAKELSNLVMKKSLKEKKMLTVWSILLAVRTCGLFLLWINLTSRQGTRAAFCGLRWAFQYLSDLQVKWGWSLGFFTMFYLSCPCTPQALQGKFGSHSLYTPCLAQQLTLDLALMWNDWYVIDWLIDWLTDV